MGHDFLDMKYKFSVQHESAFEKSELWRADREWEWTISSNAGVYIVHFVHSPPALPLNLETLLSSI